MRLLNERRGFFVGVLLVFIFGLGLRLWMTTQRLGTLDSDMAVLGLMAQHAQEFELSVFHWGQYYGGAQETYLAALLGIFTGVNKFVLQVTTIVLAATATLALWLATKEIIDRRAAWIAATLFWIWPGPFVWWSVKIGSNYWFAMTFALLSVWLLARSARKGYDRNDLILTGICLGLTLWANPQSAYVAVPALIRYCLPLLRTGMQLVWFVAGACIGAAPWLIVSIQTGFVSLRPAGGVSGKLSVGVHNLVSDVAPMVLGLKVPFSKAWLLGDVSILIAVAIAVAIFVSAFLIRPRPTLPLVALTIGLLVFSNSQWAFYTEQPRYVFWLSPWLLMLIGALLAHIPRHKLTVPVVLLLAGTMTTGQLVAMNNAPGLTYTAGDVPVPFDNSGLVRFLDTHDVDRAYADYWLAYRTTFETDERIILAPYYTDRQPDYTLAVEVRGPAPVVFLKQSMAFPRFVRYCEEQRVTCSVTTDQTYALVQPNQSIDMMSAAAAMAGNGTNQIFDPSS